MAVEIKFCGLTRVDDVAVAVALGAHYLGFIFAPSARQLTGAQGATLMESLDVLTREAAHRPARVGVFGDDTVGSIADIVRRMRLDMVQLHAACDAREIAQVREATGAKVWSVVPVAVTGMVDESRMAAALASDAVLFDATVRGRTGGTGQVFDWEHARRLVEPLRATHAVMLAGGLKPENVARAITLFAPDVVDVSSGVEDAPGVKNPARMRAFAHAVQGVVVE